MKRRGFLAALVGLVAAPVLAKDESENLYADLLRPERIVRVGDSMFAFTRHSTYEIRRRRREHYFSGERWIEPGEHWLGHLDMMPCQGPQVQESYTLDEIHRYFPNVGPVYTSGLVPLYPAARDLGSRRRPRAARRRCGW